MIISASRRTDIPAFYSEWFFDRLSKEVVYVKNPMNRKQVGQIQLTPDTVDCFVFWTKNPGPMLKKLKHLDQMGYPYFFQFTMTPYERDIEPVFTDKEEIICNFLTLSELIGKERVIWRYDPIFLNYRYTKEYHYKMFDYFCSRLSGFCDTCMISFIDIYKKIKKNMEKISVFETDLFDMEEIGIQFAKIASAHKIQLRTCDVDCDLTPYGIVPGACIDGALISQITGRSYPFKKDVSQRKTCRCVKSYDIGQYDTCVHYCNYCYANSSINRVNKNYQQHCVDSDFLCDTWYGDEKITLRS